VLALYGVAFGAGIGAVLGLISHALTGGRRDFSSRTAFVAQSYDVIVGSDLAERAIGLLERPDAPGRGTAGNRAG